MKWNIEKKMEKHREEPYTVSPWAMTWDDENYYLIAYDQDAGYIKHFRVDKIKNIRVLKDRREGLEEFKEFNLARYSKMSFGMFGGEPTRVKIAFEDEMVGVFIDRFGKDINVPPSKKKGWSEIDVEVAVSDIFLGWIFALGSSVKLLGPESIVNHFKNEIRERNDLYM